MGPAINYGDGWLKWEGGGGQVRFYFFKQWAGGWGGKCFRYAVGPYLASIEPLPIKMTIFLRLFDD